MHSRIFQLGKEPIPQYEWMVESDLPDWFFETIADAAMVSEDRKEDIERLMSSLKGIASFEDDTITFSEDAAIRYFSGIYPAFLEKLNALRGVTLEEFAGITGDCRQKIYSLNEAYNDEFSVYIYYDYRLMTMEEFFRYITLDKPFYLGGVLDYHF